MTHTKLRPRKATDLLKDDHQNVKKLFQQYDKLGPGGHASKAALFEEIKSLLTVHARIEEEFFYPAVARAQNAEASLLVREAEEEHKIVKTLLEELSGWAPGAERFDAKMKVLKENVLHHAEEEQKDLFPIFRDLEAEEQVRIAEQLQRSKRELMEGA